MPTRYPNWYRDKTSAKSASAIDLGLRAYENERRVDRVSHPSACSCSDAAAQSEFSAIPSEGVRHGESKERSSCGLPHRDVSTHARQRCSDDRVVQEGARR